jgi:GntR family transcriptional regulator
MKHLSQADRTTLFDFRSGPDKETSSPHSPSDGVDRASPLPLYHQLYQVLLAKIEKGEWKPGATTPTEKDLSAQYGLSRTTVRQALQQLSLDGYLTRRQGQGTFVTQPKMRHGPQRPFGISGYLRAHGLQPGWRLLGMERIKPLPPKVAAALGVSENKEVLCIRRLRLADDEAIGLHTMYVPFPLADRIKPELMLQGDSSLYYLESLGVTLSESHRIIEAVPARKDEARLLKVKEGSPLLMIQRTTTSADGKPVEFLRAVYRGDRFQYYVHFEH